jgi:preprotein translocase subunit SecE
VLSRVPGSDVRTEGSSSTGRAPVSKTGGWGFESLLPCKIRTLIYVCSNRAEVIVNRETKRLLQRQGQLGPDGEPIAADRDSRAASAAAARRSDGGGAGGGRGAGRAAGGGGGGAAGRSKQVEREPIWQRIAQFLREVRVELSRVAWASRSEVINYTIVVFFAVVFLTLVVYGLDAGFVSVVNFLFKGK